MLTLLKLTLEFQVFKELYNFSAFFVIMALLFL